MNKEIVNSTQSGRSMIEMLGVLAIVGVLSVGGIAGYSKAMEKFKINKSIDQISHIVANIRTLYAQQTTYDGLNTANAIKMGVVPNEMGTGTTLTNPFNENTYILADNINNNKYFIVSYAMSNLETCIALASYDWGDKNSSGLIAINIASEENVYFFGDNATCDRPYDFLCAGRIPLTTASEACKMMHDDWSTIHFNLLYQ